MIRHNPLVRKVLFSYAIAMVLVITYFIIRTLFQNEKKIEPQSFDMLHEKTLLDKNLSDNPASPLQKPYKHFILLPR